MNDFEKDFELAKDIVRSANDFMGNEVNKNSYSLTFLNSSVILGQCCYRPYMESDNLFVNVKN